MMKAFFCLLVPQLGLIGAERHAPPGRALDAVVPAQRTDIERQFAPAATFSEYEFADNHLAVYSSSIVLDYRAPE